MLNAKILVVEDEYIVAKDIQNTLKKLGYSVPALVSSGEDAIKKTEEIRPDLVLMDIVLKGILDGVETADQIRSQFNIPVVYLTAYADEDTLQRAKVTEPYGYLIKPFQERELHSTIEMALYKQNMEKQLKDSKQWLITTLNSIGEAVIATDNSGLTTFINPVAEALTGFKYQTALGKPLNHILKIIDEDTGRLIKNPVEKVLKERNIVRMAKRAILRTRDGTEIPIIESGAPIISDNEEIVGVVLVIQDVTEHKRIEEVVRESEERYKQLVNSFPEPMVVFGEGKLVYVNLESIKLIGAADSAELIGKSIIEFIHPDYQEDFTARIRESHISSKLQKAIKLKLVRLDGGILDVDLSATPIIYYGKDAVQIVLKDITERQQAEVMLRESEEKYRSLVESSNDGIVIIQDEIIKYINPRLEEITGYRSNQVLGTKFTEYFPPSEVPKVVKRYKQRMAGKKFKSGYESALIHKNGNRIDIEINGDVITYQGKTADLVYIHDITHRKQVENALRESEEKYRRLIETSPDGIIFTDLKGRILMVNNQTLLIHGCENAKELMGKNAFEFIAPEDRNRAVTNAQKVLDEGKIENIQYKLLRKDGTHLYGEIRCALITDAEKNPKGFICVLRDVTERIRMEESLQESEARFRHVFENATIGIYRTTPDGQITMANPRLVQMLGYSSFEELAKRNLEKSGFEPEYQRSEFKKEIESKGQILGLEAVWIRKDGTSLFIRESARVIKDENGNVLYYEGIVDDITESKRAEEALRDSETQLRTTLNSMADAIHVVNSDLRFVMMNRAFLQWNKELGLEKEIMGKKLFEVFPFLPKKVQNEYKTVFKTGETVTSEEKTRIGECEFITETRKIPVIEKGKVTQVITVIHDITELRHTEEAYRRLVDQSLQGLIIIQDRRIVFANPATTEITGYSNDELSSFTFDDLKKITHPDDRERVWSHIYKRLTGKAVPPRIEFRFIRRNDEVRWVETLANKIKYKGKPAIQAVVIDITQRKLP